MSSISITIGGSKGHEIEQIDASSTFTKAFKMYRWKMIPNCTGRYTCRDHKLVSNLHPSLLMQNILSLNSKTERDCERDSESESESGLKSESHGKCKCDNNGNSNDFKGENSTIDVNTSTCSFNSNSKTFRSFYFEFPNETRKDPIVVIPFDKLSQTGFISYVKVKSNNTNITRAGNHDYVSGQTEVMPLKIKESPSPPTSISFVHTLNAPSGFQRKLDAIGIAITSDHDIVQKDGSDDL